MEQVFLKLQHESGVEHLYLLKLSGKRYEITLVHFLCMCVYPVLVYHCGKVQCLLQISEAFLNQNLLNITLRSQVTTCMNQLSLNYQFEILIEYGVNLLIMVSGLPRDG